jgi:putative ABC transport system ATP-binding protein
LTPLVRIRSLTHTFGQGEARKEVLTAVDLDLVPGELAIMSGPSGSGKTTLLSLIGALRTVQAGSLQVMGRELKDQEPGELLAYRRQLGFIFQHHNLFPALTAAESVRTALDLQDIDPAQAATRVRDILRRLGLEHRTEHKPARLSGGQRQRVAIARALVHQPRLILADEPTAALDKDTGRGVVDLLKQLVRDNGATALMVTHDMRLLDTADRIVNMVDGRLVSNIQVADVLEVCGFLKDSGLFAARSPAELMEIASKTFRQAYAPGDAVITQGEEGDRFYMIREGSVAVEAARDGAPLKRVATLARGSSFGERALISREPRSATVRALEPVEVYCLGKEDFEEAVSNSKTFKDQLLGAIFQRS